MWMGLRFTQLPWPGAKSNIPYAAQLHSTSTDVQLLKGLMSFGGYKEAMEIGWWQLEV